MNVVPQDLLDSGVRDWFCRRCRRAVQPGISLRRNLCERREREFTTIMMTEIKLLWQIWQQQHLQSLLFVLYVNELLLFIIFFTSLLIYWNEISSRIKTHLLLHLSVFSVTPCFYPLFLCHTISTASTPWIYSFLLPHDEW